MINFKQKFEIIDYNKFITIFAIKTLYLYPPYVSKFAEI